MLDISVRSSDNHLRAISQEIPQLSVLNLVWNITKISCKFSSGQWVNDYGIVIDALYVKLFWRNIDFYFLLVFFFPSVMAWVVRILLSRKTKAWEAYIINIMVADALGKQGTSISNHTSQSPIWVLELKYSRITKSKPQLLMFWLPASPGHQQQWITK